MNRISVVGTSGSGKTTFAGKLSKILRIPHVELDSLNWEAGWTPAPRDVFRSRVHERTDGFPGCRLPEIEVMERSGKERHHRRTLRRKRGSSRVTEALAYGTAVVVEPVQGASYRA